MACIESTTSVYVICVLHICNMYNLCLSGSFFLASVCNELSLVGFETQLPELWKNPGWFGYIRDEILPSYVGIIINHNADPYSTTSIMECHKFFFFRGSIVFFLGHGQAIPTFVPFWKLCCKVFRSRLFCVTKSRIFSYVCLIFMVNLSSLKLTAKAPENRPFQKETNIPPIYFQVRNC